MEHTKMTIYKVTGRIRADIHFEETIHSISEESAVEEVSDKICRKHKIGQGDYIDDEIYCEKIQ